MSDELNPGAATAPDVPEKTVTAEVQEETVSADTAESETEARTPDYSEMSLAELSQAFVSFSEREDRLDNSKEAESIKAAFYRKLSREKISAGQEASGAEANENPDGESQEANNNNEASSNPFSALESGFKALYLKYKKERAEYNRKVEEERSANLVKKQAIVDELKELVDGQEDLGTAFPAFRDLQARWRAVGQVPVQNFRNLNDTYQFYVEQFYDKVQINRDLRDLDFKKNLEVKEGFCELAEKLSENEDIVSAFKELQRLHEQWKEYGPVAKEFREQIWDRFKAATSIINKKYQAYFEEQKSKQCENLAAKTVLCEKAEAIAADETIDTIKGWTVQTEVIEALQKEWKGIGYATKKENQKIYDRFRAACDKFFERKKDYFSQYKDTMNANVGKKQSIIEEVQSLKNTDEWKKATDRIISLQNQWKEIGAVPRKKSEQLWKRFRAACDEFFEARDSSSTYVNYSGNLKAKKALIEEILAYEPDGGKPESEARRDFAARWQEIGFVPFKEKERINQAYNEAMEKKFGCRPASRNSSGRAASQKNSVPRTEKEKLIAKYGSLQQDLDTYENNIGFFALSKNSQPLIEQMKARIENVKAELKAIEDRIHAIEASEANQE